MNRTKAVGTAALVLLMVVGRTWADAARVFRFGDHPIDVHRQEKLNPGECMVETTGDQGPVTVRVGGVPGVFSDTAIVPSGTQVVIGPDKRALYIAECGNDVVGDWWPVGIAHRCELSLPLPVSLKESIQRPLAPQDPDTAGLKLASGAPTTTHIEMPCAVVGDGVACNKGFDKRHLWWIVPAALVTGAAMCHNRIFGLCGTENGDNHWTVPVGDDPNGPEQQCKNGGGGCDDDDDDGGHHDDDDDN